VWHVGEMRWGRVLAIALAAGIAGALVWALIASVFEPPGFVNLLFVAVVTIVVGRALLPYAAKNRGGERR
jgi:xanthosine utilization system XapX-like protein